MPLKLPTRLAEYFAAANAGDADRVAACFAADAVVHDEGRVVRGRAAVRAWAAETRRRYRFHAAVIDLVHEDDRAVVTALLTGDFPGSPVDLRYRFKLAGPEIASLEIA